MLAVVKSRPAPGFELHEVPEPDPQPGEVLISVQAASICGTDVHLYDWNPWAAARVHPPRIVGHEICGSIVSGDGPTDSLVAIESHVVCHHCAACERGDFHVCANTRIIGVDVDGGFAPYIAVPAENAHPIAGQNPQVIAALDPLGNAVHACSYAQMRGATVLILGCGPIGCACVAVAKAKGAERIIAADPNDYRLRLAERMGADTLLRADANLQTQVRDLGCTVDVVLEMSGAPSAVAAATRIIRPGGSLALLGLGDGDVTLDLSNDVVMKGVTIQGVVGRRIPQTWTEAINYLNAGTIDVRALITHQLPMQDIDQAISLIKSGQCGKISLSPPQ